MFEMSGAKTHGGFYKSLNAPWTSPEFALGPDFCKDWLLIPVEPSEDPLGNSTHSTRSLLHTLCSGKEAQIDS